jgi:hypothetical protein
LLKRNLNVLFFLNDISMKVDIRKQEMRSHRGKC